MRRRYRNTSVELGESWATEDYNGPISDDESSGYEGTGSEDIELDNNSETDDQHTPLRPTSHIIPPQASSSRSHLLSTPVPAVPSEPSPQIAIQRRASPNATPVRPSPRVNAVEQTVEPSFIMPSMQHDSMDASWTRSSSMSASGFQRNMRRASLENSYHRSSPRSSQQLQRTPSRQSSGTRRRRQEPVTRQTRGASAVLEEDQPWILPRQAWVYVFQPIFNFGLSVITMALQISKPFIAYLLIIWLLYAALIGFRNRATASLTNVFSPLCHIPGISYLNPPFCAPPPKESGSIEFEQLLSAQSTFEDVLLSSNEIASLPYDMKRSEASIRDLRTVIHYSSLPSKNELAFEFTGFIDAARQASSDLAAFDSRVGRAVDGILSTNRWTMSVLSNLLHDEFSRGAISRYLSKINPFSSKRTPRDVVLDQYLRHTREVEDQVAAVIMEAQGLLLLLKSLDERLDAIAFIATRDGVTVRDNRDELLLSLWTRLGGNKASMSRLDDHLALLRSVGAYQRTAWQHVSATVLKLQAIAAQLEDLRERVAAPGVVGTDNVPLEVHIESIRLGVERLEGVRGESRRVHGETYQSLIRGGQGGTTRSNDGSLIDRGTVTIDNIPRGTV